MSAINFEPVKYEQLTKVQKLAIFMIAIGEDASSQLLKGFEDAEIEIICREISNIKIIDSSLRKRVVEEFSEVIGESLSATLGGAGFALRTLEKAKGDFKAANILGRIAPVGTSSEIIDEISDMPPLQILNLIRNEQPQTIAFVISHLNIDKLIEVIQMLDDEVQDQVLELLGDMDETSIEVVEKVVSTLRKRIKTKVKQTVHHSGGVRQVADVLNGLDRKRGNSILSKIEERNPGLGTVIRKKMFSFEDLIKIEPSDLQRVTREVETADLVVAMKSANTFLQDAIYNSISKRAADTIRDEIEMLGPVRLKDVEAAQDKIIQIVRKLEEEGEITLDSGGDRVIA